MEKNGRGGRISQASEEILDENYPHLFAMHLARVLTDCQGRSYGLDIKSDLSRKLYA